MSAPVRLPLNDALAAERPMLRRLAAVAFLDVVGYSRLMGGDEDATLREWASLQRMVIEPRVVTWRGRIANKAGDGIFLEFRSALDAFRWAVDVQKAIGARKAAIKLQVRVALHLGDVIDDADGEVQGDGVNTAARLQSFAKPGGIVVSQAIANEVLGKTEVVFEDLGPLQLKNMARPVHAFQVGPGHSHSGLGGLVSIIPRRDAARAEVVRPFVAPRPAAARSFAWLKKHRGVALNGCLAAVGAGALAVAVLLPRADRVGPVAASGPAHDREAAMRLYDEGRAVGCAEFPCPREWLAARALYEKAIAADPSYPPPYAHAAFTYTNFIRNDLSLNEAADQRQAEKLATEGAALDPGNAVSHEARAEVLVLNPDRLQDGLAAYSQSLAINPAQPVVRANIGWTLILLGRPAEAEAYLREALAAAPGHKGAPSWMTSLGLAQLFADQPGHGAEAFRNALAHQTAGMTGTEIALQRTLYLAAALALNGEGDDAKRVVDGVRRQNPTLSARAVWDCTCSHEAGFLAGFAILKKGIVLAGIPDTP